MASVAYTATGRVVPYHVLNADYALDFETSDVVPPAGGALRERTESLNGSVETLYFGAKRVWQITTIPLQRLSALGAVLREFLDSTVDGQEFQFDPYGGAADPAEPLTVVREDEGHSQSVFMVIDGKNDLVQYSFQVREVV